MPTNNYVREKILRILNSVTEPPNPGYITRRELARRVGSSYSARVNEMIGLMLSEGVLVAFGTGHRGDPVRIAMGKNFPVGVCPMCKQRMSSYYNLMTDQVATVEQTPAQNRAA